MIIIFFLFEVCVLPYDFVPCVFSTPVIIWRTPLCVCQYLHNFWAKCVKGHITNLLSRKDSTKGQQLGKSPTLVMWVHLSQLCCILCSQTVWHLGLDQVLAGLKCNGFILPSTRQQIHCNKQTVSQEAQSTQMDLQTLQNVTSSGYEIAMLLASSVYC